MSRRAPRSRNALSVGRFLACLVAVTALVVGTVVPVTAASATVAPATAGASSATSADLARSVGEGADTSMRPATLVGFNPGNIISDAMFAKKGTMSESKIQSFLNSKVTNCRSGYVCLKSAKDKTRSIAASPMCNAYNGGGTETAARIIYKVAQACGINPQVLLVMLEKEQGLVTHTWPSDWRYTIAMGQGCPDTAACDTRYYGFFNQLYGAASQLKRYENPPGTSQFFTWYAPGKTWNLRYHPNASCGSSPVYIRNQATSNLYYYTPYQPNSASLKAGTGTGNSCSSYGNRNFYHFFTSWFGSTQASNPCSASAATISASWTYVVRGSLTGRSVPNSDCATGSVSVANGTIAKASAATADKSWVKLLTPSGSTWVPMDRLEHATTEQAACALPKPAGSASWTYVVQAEPVTGRRGPSTSCGYDTRTIPGGTIAKALQVSADDKWIKLDTPAGIRWVERSQITHASSAQAACLTPRNVGPASWVYTVGTAGASGRIAPASGCSYESVPLRASTVAPAVAVSSDDKWIQLSTDSGRVWVARSEIRAATAAEKACLAPAPGTPASEVYVVGEEGAVGRSVASVGCDLNSGLVPGGTVATSEQVSADGTMRLLRTPGAMRWVHQDDIRVATKEERVCVYPSDTGPATATFVTNKATIGRFAPTTKCASEEYGIGANATVTAIRQSADGKWRLISTRGGFKWVASSDLTWLRTN